MRDKKIVQFLYFFHALAYKKQDKRLTNEDVVAFSVSKMKNLFIHFSSFHFSFAFDGKCIFVILLLALTLFYCDFLSAGFVLGRRPLEPNGENAR